eukprot:354695-Chlamydomonas_euryale.AAC.4
MPTPGTQSHSTCARPPHASSLPPLAPSDATRAPTADTLKGPTRAVSCKKRGGEGQQKQRYGSVGWGGRPVDCLDKVGPCTPPCAGEGGGEGGGGRRTAVWVGRSGLTLVG